MNNAHRDRINSKEEKRVKSPSSIASYIVFRRRCLLSTFLIIICLATCLTLLWETCLFCAGSLKGHEEYGIVIDAGSTGSRVFLYQMLDNKLIETSLGICNPGIHVVTSRNGFDCILTHLKDAMKIIPIEEASHTPVFLMATAGMRLLPEENQNLIYKYIYEGYRLSGLPFLFPLSHIKTISGDTEAYYNWVAVQYLSNTLPLDIHTRLKPTLGALDLGGSSTQIMFEPRDPYGSIRGNIIQVHEEHVFSRSFLDMGVNRMKTKVDDAVLKLGDNHINESLNITFKVTRHPCYYKGYFEEYISDLQQRIQIIGTGDFPACISLLRDVVEVNAECLNPPCSFGGIYTPKVKGNFIATSAFYYIIHSIHVFLPNVMKFPTPSLREMERAIRSICSAPWNVIFDEFKTKDMHTPIDRLPYRCLEATYILVLLKDGYKFNDRFRNITFSISISNSNLNWALGAMLSMHAEFPQPDHIGYNFCYSLMIAVTALLGLFIMLNLLLKCYRWWSRPVTRYSTINPVISPVLPQGETIIKSRSLVDMAAMLSMTMRREGSYLFDKEVLDGTKDI